MSGFIGTLAAGVGCAVALADRFGTTPAWLYFRQSTLMTRVAIGSVPIEYVIAFWFLLALLIVGGRQTRTSVSTVFVFGTATAVIGFSAWFLLVRNARCWSMVAVALSAGGLLSALVADPIRWVPQAGAAHSRAWLRARAMAALALAVAVGAGIQVRASAIPTADALRADLIRWYATRTPRPAALAAGLSSSNGVRVTVFTDYQSPRDRFDVPRKAAIVQAFRARGLAVELAVRDFPQTASCNPGSTGTHEAACDAARAVRVARLARGAAVANDLAIWMYQRGPALTTGVIRGHVSELGLAQEYDRRSVELNRDLEDDLRLARALGVTATPIYFVNGVWIPTGTDVLPWILEFESKRHALASLSLLGR